MVKIIAVDFDGCICTNMFPHIGIIDETVIQRLLKEQENGAKLILWTCREGLLLREAVNACKEHGLFFDAINDNIPELVVQYGCNSRKVSATEYWDDRGVVVKAG